MARKTLSVSDAISFGWKTTKKNLWFFVSVILISIGVSAIPSILSNFLDSNKQPMFGLIVSLIGWALQMVVSLGIINVALRIYDRKKAKREDLFKNWNLVIPYFLASIIYGAIVLVGLLLLIVPGIIWSIKFQFFAYYMVDRGMGPIDALKASSKATKGVRWNLFWLKLLLGLINIVGLLCLVVGLAVTIPIGFMAEAYAYRKINGK